MRAINLVLKRLMDIFGSLIGIVILLPVLIIVALAIKIDSKGPVFFRQERLGKNGKVFKILKFRTMVINSENIGDGFKIKNENDSRITKIGKLLRRFSVDELPQLFNVFIGEMSLVGPRPPLTYHPYSYELYPEKHKKRFDFKPGITGLSQVKVRAKAPWEVRLEFDSTYVTKFNVLLDIKLILLTFFIIFRKEGIYLDE